MMSFSFDGGIVKIAMIFAHSLKYLRCILFLGSQTIQLTVTREDSHGLQYMKNTHLTKIFKHGSMDNWLKWSKPEF